MTVSERFVLGEIREDRVVRCVVVRLADTAERVDKHFRGVSRNKCLRVFSGVAL